MLNKIRKNLKDKAGFTLVELIVVLVILAILAAMLVPALTGYIDKANKEKITAECRQVVMAAQTEASALYGKANGGELTNAMLKSNDYDYVDAVGKLSEVKDSAKFTIVLEKGGAVKSVTYTNSGWTVTYENSAYTDPAKQATATARTAGVATATGSAE